MAMGFEVVALDMRHVHGLSDAGHLIDLAGQTQQVRVINNAALIGFEVLDIHRIKSQQSHKQTNVGLGKLLAGEVTIICKNGTFLSICEVSFCITSAVVTNSSNLNS